MVNQIDSKSQQKMRVNKIPSALIPLNFWIRYLNSSLQKQSQLADTLFAHIPRSHLRAAEWSIDFDNTVAVTACLKKRVQLQIVEEIANSIHLPQASREQLIAMCHLPCWRHTIRIDSKKGVSLYIERDWEPDLLRSVASWFASPYYLIDKAFELTANRMFVVAGIGIHWKHDGKIRFRIYNVSVPERSFWKVCSSRLIDFIESNMKGHSKIIQRLLNQPRRACLINLEDCSGKLGIKVEIPDIQWSEIENLVECPVKSSIGQFIKKIGRKPIRYLGVRIRHYQPVTATLYFDMLRRSKCGLPI